MTAAVRLVLVEDNQVFRETLELLLGLRPDIDVIASVATGNEAPMICAECPNLLLLQAVLRQHPSRAA